MVMTKMWCPKVIHFGRKSQFGPTKTVRTRHKLQWQFQFQCICYYPKYIFQTYWRTVLKRTPRKKMITSPVTTHCEDLIMGHGAIRNRKLEQNENISGSQTGAPNFGKEEEYWNCNPRHLVMPVSFAICHNSLFVTKVHQVTKCI